MCSSNAGAGERKIVLTVPIQSSADNGEMILAGHHNSDLQPRNGACTKNYDLSSSLELSLG